PRLVDRTIISPVFSNLSHAVLTCCVDNPTSSANFFLPVINCPLFMVSPRYFLSSKLPLNKQCINTTFVFTSSYHSHFRNFLCSFIQPVFILLPPPLAPLIVA